MTDNVAHADEKDVRRRKQLRKMTKIVTKAWELPNAEPFQESHHHHHHGSSKVAYDLTTIGQHIDQKEYGYGRSGWEHFAKDLGGVYNRHIVRKTKHAEAAKRQVEQILPMLHKIDASLASAASNYCPPEAAHDKHHKKHHHEHAYDEHGKKHAKKRKIGETSTTEMSKKKKHAPEKRNGDSKTLTEREEKALETLASYIEEVGGSRDQVSSYRSRVTKKSDGRHDINFFNSEGKRFRSMIEVARFLGLVSENSKAPAAKKHVKNSKHRNKQMTSRECEAEKKKLRRELDKLLKAHRKATKALDDFQDDQKESQYPVDDELLMEEEAAKNVPLVVTRTTCPAARVPDIDGFPSIPAYCIPDVIMTWDFLCTFGRALSLNPISLDDFAAALIYKPRTVGGESSDMIPPIYIAEAHLGLLRLLLNDTSSDDWWYSTLETDEAAVADADYGETALSNADADSNIPVIKVDMAALLADDEDPVATASWLQALEDVRNHRTNAGGQIRQAVKSAMSISSNKWVKAYLKIAIQKWKGNSAGFTKRAVLWLVDRVRDARPDLWGRNVRKEALFQQRAKVVEEVALAMEKMDETADVVVVDDSEGDSDDDIDSDESDDEDETEGVQPLKADANDETVVNGDSETRDESALPVTSAIPVKPPPTVVDLLLPPKKPTTPSDIVSPFTWSALAGAAACRVLHRYKRRRNEIDDSIRDFRELPPMSIAERRRRESVAAIRTLTECAANAGEGNDVESAIAHLSSGGSYLDLTAIQRLCLFRLLIEGAYDTARIHEVVDENYNSRINALKALGAEERRAKREAKEEAAAAEIAAREQLASEAREKFLDEKKHEIVEENKRTNEYTSEFIEGLTEEDIAEFDEETKTEYDALPGPESFNKTEVNKMVARMQEEAAFNTHSLVVLTMDELLIKEKNDLESMEQRLASFGDVDALYLNQSIDRETSKSIERLRKDIENAKHFAVSLPQVREEAVEILKDAIEDGTIKVLRAAIRLAKQARLTGPVEDTGGIWALDLLRDAALELKSAERHKRVLDAQKDLVAKRNKCFIRSEPLGRDRFRNRFWHFDNDESGRVWVEDDYILKDTLDNNLGKRDDPNYVDLVVDSKSILIGEEDREEDFLTNDSSVNSRALSRFCRQEYHPAGSIGALVQRYWGGHTTETSLRALIKNLDSRGVREKALKSNLKVTLDDRGLLAAGDGQPQETKEHADNGDVSGEKSAEGTNDFGTSGDEDVFSRAKATETNPSAVVDPQLVEGLSSAIGKRVRVRQAIDPTKVPVFATYDMGTVTGWKMYREEETENDEHENSANGGTESVQQAVASPVPVWRAILDRGEEVLLDGTEVIESLCRAIKWKNQDKEYTEDDSAFLAYRNSLGRYCGRAADAAMSSSPMFLARLMMKREQELYAPLKNRTFDNNWGGKSGARNSWVTQMKDYCYDLSTVRGGLLTLENAFFELTGGFLESGEVEGADVETLDGKSLLNDESCRFNIELESIDKKVRGLWNCPASRSIFYEIVESSTTTGILALALDLLCRNCRAYLNAHKLTGSGTVAQQPATTRTRRMNAWQQANQSLYY